MSGVRIFAITLSIWMVIAADATVSAQTGVLSTAPGTRGRPTIDHVDPTGEFIPASDSERIVRSDGWVQGGGGRDGGSRNRYYWPLHVRTNTPGATLTLDFRGRGVSAVFHTPRVRAYGSQWKNGRMKATVDQAKPVEFVHDQEALEVVLAEGLEPGPHRLVLEHLENGCTLLGFRTFDQAVGHLEGTLTGENPDYLFDVRLSVWRDNRLVRTGLHRNWLSGRYRVTGLPPGENLRLQIEAIGWTSAVRDVKVEAGKTTVLDEIELKQLPGSRRSAITWPALGYQAIRVPNEIISIQGVDDSGWRHARLVRRNQEAEFSRVAGISTGESGALEFTVPADTPPGVYDLQLLTSDSSQPPVMSPRSVVIRHRHASGGLRIITWGHTDTWGQLQGEFECALAHVASVAGPDLVLVSNSVNPAVIAGAMSRMDVPYLINFGNHRLRGHEQWYGDQVGMVEMGSEFAVFNFGLLWKEDTTGLEKLMQSRRNAPGKILNTLESDVPTELLVRNDVRLMHDAHGWLKPKVLLLPDTPTMRVGKWSASSFRFVAMEQHRVTDVSEPLEVPRVVNAETPWVPDPPLRVVYEQSMSGGQEAVVVNDLPCDVPRARVVFVAPPGEWQVSRGTIESQAVSDDGKWQEIVVRIDAPAEKQIRVSLQRK